MSFTPARSMTTAAAPPKEVRARPTFPLLDEVQMPEHFPPQDVFVSVPEGTTMDWRPTMDDVLQDLCERGIQCGMATMPSREIRAWIEVDGELIEERVEPSPRVSDQIAFWLRENADRIHGEDPDLLRGVLSDNVVDARSRFLMRRSKGPTKEAFTP